MHIEFIQNYKQTVTEGSKLQYLLHLFCESIVSKLLLNNYA